MTHILANKLYLSSDAAVDLKDWTYRWTERISEDAVDEFGNVVTDARGFTQATYHTEPKQLETYRYLVGTNRYLSLPRGNLGKIQPWLNANDLRPVSSLPFNLQIADHVVQDHRWPDQKRCIDAWLSHGYGIIKGTTGSGKTIMGTGVMSALNLTTLIMSTLLDGNDQWEREIRKHTNIEDWEKKLGCRLVGPYRAKKTPYPISICTVQTFLHEAGYESLIRHQSDFSLVLVDEADGFAAPEFSRILGLWNPLCFCGLTATPERNDHRHHLLYDLIGPVVTEGTADQMRPQVYLIETGVGAPAWLYGKPYSREYRWAKTLDFLSHFEPRHQVIYDNIIPDIEAKRVVGVYSDRRSIVKWLYRKLRKNHYDVAYVDGQTKGREKIYKDFCSGIYQCLLAGKVLNKLVNLPELDCLHVTTPAVSVGRVTQIVGRTRRELKGKPIPLVKYYLDHRGQMEGGRKSWLKICRAENWQAQIILAPKQGLSAWTQK